MKIEEKKSLTDTVELVGEEVNMAKHRFMSQWSAIGMNCHKDCGGIAIGMNGLVCNFSN
jgi:hypothetical protein